MDISENEQNESTIYSDVSGNCESEPPEAELLINIADEEVIPFPEALTKMVDLNDTFGIFKNTGKDLHKPLLPSPISSSQELLKPILNYERNDKINVLEMSCLNISWSAPDSNQEKDDAETAAENIEASDLNKSNLESVDILGLGPNVLNSGKTNNDATSYKNNVLLDFSFANSSVNHHESNSEICSGEKAKDNEVNTLEIRQTAGESFLLPLPPISTPCENALLQPTVVKHETNQNDKQFKHFNLESVDILGLGPRVPEKANNDVTGYKNNVLLDFFFANSSFNNPESNSEICSGEKTKDGEVNTLEIHQATGESFLLPLPPISGACEGGGTLLQPTVVKQDTNQNPKQDNHILDMSSFNISWSDIDTLQDTQDSKLVSKDNVAEINEFDTDEITNDIPDEFLSTPMHPIVASTDSETIPIVDPEICMVEKTETLNSSQKSFNDGVIDNIGTNIIETALPLTDIEVKCSEVVENRKNKHILDMSDLSLNCSNLSWSTPERPKTCTDDKLHILNPTIKETVIHGLNKMSLVEIEQEQFVIDKEQVREELKIPETSAENISNLKEKEAFTAVSEELKNPETSIAGNISYHIHKDEDQLALPCAMESMDSCGQNQFDNKVSAEPKVSSPPKVSSQSGVLEKVWTEQISKPATDKVTRSEDDEFFIPPLVKRPPVATIESIRKLVEDIFRSPDSPDVSPTKYQTAQKTITDEKALNLDQTLAEPVDPIINSPKAIQLNQLNDSIDQHQTDINLEDSKSLPSAEDVHLTYKKDFSTPKSSRNSIADTSLRRGSSDTLNVTFGFQKTMSSPCFTTPVRPVSNKNTTPSRTSTRASSCTKLSFSSTSSNSSAESEGQRLPLFPGKAVPVKTLDQRFNELTKPAKTKLKFESKPAAGRQPLKATLSTEFAVRAKAEVANTNNSQLQANPIKQTCASAPVQRKYASPIAASSPNPKKSELNSSFTKHNNSFSEGTPSKRNSSVKSSGYGRPNLNSSQVGMSPRRTSAPTVPCAPKFARAPSPARPVLKSAVVVEPQNAASTFARARAPSPARPVLKYAVVVEPQNAQPQISDQKDKEKILEKAPAPPKFNKENIPKLINRFGFRK